MEETEYLRGNGVLVTSNRIELDGQTFAVRNVGSVKVTKPGLPWFAALIFLGTVVAGFAPGLYGLLLVALVVAFYIWTQFKLRRLVLVSGGGETIALKSTNGSHIENIRAAIAQAISAR